MPIVKKKKHVSKKGKKEWRKYCDIKDVEDFLEDQRLEERLGKFDTKPDSELFVVDTGGADGEQQDGQKEPEKPLSAKQRRRAKLAAPPKCFEILQSTSKVQDPNAKRNHVNPIGTRPTALSKITEARKEKKGAYEKKLELARKNRKIAFDKKKKAKIARQTFGMDVWGDSVPEAKGIPSTLVGDFISPEAQLHNVLPERRLRPKPPLARTVVARSKVAPPHPGVSYNPSYEEHQALLRDVVSHEEQLMKREQHLLRVTTGMFSRVTEKQRDENWRKEMSAGLPTAEEPEDKSDADTDDEVKSVNPPVKNKKKDHKARRKQKEQILEKERLKRAKIDKKKISDIYRLRKLQVAIKTTESQQEVERTQRRSKRLQVEATAPPQLSGHKTAKPEPDFVEPATLTGDLRNITSSTNLLKERYQSLQHRGAIAASRLMMKKKKRVKSYFKAGHKVTDQDVEKYVKDFKANTAAAKAKAKAKV
ncbi:unnamed protein product [Plutella xylostella]|uniref:Ribosome biogenesis protein NOP53 n=1 Tax=Plutella xylostella TaxID=51655 RepID=A0A8S4FVL5_PLUXY|nr:unnamed protein product [Plutella xylostella]